MSCLANDCFEMLYSETAQTKKRFRAPAPGMIPSFSSPFPSISSSVGYILRYFPTGRPDRLISTAVLYDGPRLPEAFLVASS
jgi:hypothetical protein